MAHVTSPESLDVTYVNGLPVIPLSLRVRLTSVDIADHALRSIGGLI